MSFKSVTTTHSYLFPTYDGRIVRKISEYTRYRNYFNNHNKECLDYLDWFCDNYTEHKDTIHYHNYHINNSNGHIVFSIYEYQYFTKHNPHNVVSFIKQYEEQLPPSQVKSARNV